jgi:hypothetical protein
MVVLDVHQNHATQAGIWRAGGTAKPVKVWIVFSGSEWHAEAHVHDAPRIAWKRREDEPKGVPLLGTVTGRFMEFSGEEESNLKTHRLTRRTAPRMQQEDIDRVQEFRKCIEAFFARMFAMFWRPSAHEIYRSAIPDSVAALEMHPLDTEIASTNCETRGNRLPQHLKCAARKYARKH